MHATILFTDASLATAGMMVVSRAGGADHWSIDRHAHEQGEYVHAFAMHDNSSFQPLHYSERGMLPQEAIDRL